MARLLALILAAVLLAPVAQAAGRAPKWSELQPAAQQVLAPFADQWDRLTDSQRAKFVGVAARYPKLPPEKQMLVTQRLKDWAKLPHTEREVARARYKKLIALKPKQRIAVKHQWEKKRREMAAVEAPEATGDDGLH